MSNDIVELLEIFRQDLKASSKKNWADLYNRVSKALASLQAEPIGEIDEYDDGMCAQKFGDLTPKGEVLPIGTKIYTHAQAAKVPEGWEIHARVSIPADEPGQRILGYRVTLPKHVNGFQAVDHLPDLTAPTAIPKPPEGFTQLAYNRAQGEWLYLNHANTWNTCPCPVPTAPAAGEER